MLSSKQLKASCQRVQSLEDQDSNKSNNRSLEVAVAEKADESTSYEATSREKQVKSGTSNLKVSRERVQPPQGQEKNVPKPMVAEITDDITSPQPTSREKQETSSSTRPKASHQRAQPPEEQDCNMYKKPSFKVVVAQKADESLSYEATRREKQAKSGASTLKVSVEKVQRPMVAEIRDEITSRQPTSRKKQGTSSSNRTKASCQRAQPPKEQDCNMSSNGSLKVAMAAKADERTSCQPTSRVEHGRGSSSRQENKSGTNRCSREPVQVELIEVIGSYQQTIRRSEAADMASQDSSLDPQEGRPAVKGSGDRFPSPSPSAMLDLANNAFVDKCKTTLDGGRRRAIRHRARSSFGKRLNMKKVLKFDSCELECERRVTVVPADAGPIGHAKEAENTTDCIPVAGEDWASTVDESGEADDGQARTEMGQEVTANSGQTCGIKDGQDELNQCLPNLVQYCDGMIKCRKKLFVNLSREESALQYYFSQTREVMTNSSNDQQISGPKSGQAETRPARKVDLLNREWEDSPAPARGSRNETNIGQLGQGVVISTNVDENQSEETGELDRDSGVTTVSREAGQLETVNIGGGKGASCADAGQQSSKVECVDNENSSKKTNESRSKVNKTANSSKFFSKAATITGNKDAGMDTRKKCLTGDKTDQKRKEKQQSEALAMEPAANNILGGQGADLDAAQNGEPGVSEPGIGNQIQPVAMSATTTERGDEQATETFLQPDGDVSQATVTSLVVSVSTTTGQAAKGRRNVREKTLGHKRKLMSSKHSVLEVTPELMGTEPQAKEVRYEDVFGGSKSSNRSRKRKTTASTSSLKSRPAEKGLSVPQTSFDSEKAEEEYIVPSWRLLRKSVKKVVYAEPNSSSDFGMDEDDLVVPRTKSIIGTRKATRKSDVYSYGESDSETPQTGTAKRSRNTYSRKKGTKRPRRLFCSEESDDDKSDDSVINQPVTFKTGRNFSLAGEKQNCRYLMQP